MVSCWEESRWWTARIRDVRDVLGVEEEHAGDRVGCDGSETSVQVLSAGVMRELKENYWKMVYFASMSSL